MNSWNGLDFFIFLIFAVNTLLGMSRGATKEIISLMCLSLALIITIKFTVPLATFFNSSPLIMDVVTSKLTKNFMMALGAGPLTSGTLKEVFYSISILICFVGTFSLGEAIFSVSGFVEVFRFPYAALNRKLGAVLGCTRGYVISLMLLVILTLHVFKTEHGYTDNRLLRNSFFANLFQNATMKLDEIIIGQRPEQYREIYRDKDLYTPTDVYKQIGN